MITQQKFNTILSYFQQQYPAPATELHYNSTYELIVAVLLSAQCTDKRVNALTPGFFRAFPTLEVLANSSVEAVYDYIKTCSYPNNKANYLVKLARRIQNEFNGRIPSTRADLQKLPGIGRKSANVLALTLHDEPVFPVDTHVYRVAERIGLTENAKTSFQTEQQLQQIIPKPYIKMFHHWLVLHGRYICKARKPNCQKCGISPVCDYYNTGRQSTNKET